MGSSEVAPPAFARVAPALFIGNARAARATELLGRAGITLCVNVSRQQPGPRAPGVAELRVPVFDDPAEDLLTHLEPTCAAMEAAVRDGGSCLVYCKNGRSRSAAVCTAYLMRHRGQSLERAFQVRASEGGSSGAARPPHLERGSSGAGPTLHPGAEPPRSGLSCRRVPLIVDLLVTDGEERSPGSRAQSGFLGSAAEVRTDPPSPGPPAPGPRRSRVSCIVQLLGGQACTLKEGVPSLLFTKGNWPRVLPPLDGSTGVSAEEGHFVYSSGFGQIQTSEVLGRENA